MLSAPGTVTFNNINDVDVACGYRELHIAAELRKKYDLDQSLFSITGRAVFPNFRAAHVLAEKINRDRGAETDPSRAVHASELLAAGLLHEVLHAVIARFLNANQAIFAEAVDYVQAETGGKDLHETLEAFCRAFPPLAVYLNQVDVRTYLAEYTGATPNTHVTLEELMLLRVANENPALDPFRELFDDERLGDGYKKIFRQMESFFASGPEAGPDGETLLDLLRAPARRGGKTVAEQLQFIRTRWKDLLDDAIFERLLRSLDFIKEEEKARWMRFHGPGPGPPPLEVIDYAALDHEPERFSQDLHWMPRVVMIAKSTLVWLDQLSKKYRRDIRRLDQIPDEELNVLANCGFTALWLIGLWRRSKASKKIKQMMGNPDAESSAYALDDYEIAEDLGGYGAYENLKERCRQRDIRLASDMVPNHTALDSRWVMQHPDWFLQLPYSPFPSYTFNGPNLSEHPGVGIYLEDHYYDRTDAAVVFKRVDFNSGETRYVYHGNDGTSMPWNDTAQVNYMLPEVREAVIQTILHVARHFPIIRFDAAMILAKKHFQRLWFPEPGSGGGIPSRAEHGMSRREFDRHMPEEFWREVVERVQQEVPDTLLLAEAFWFMEGYFVRSLGMHRVYNSAFMNMLKQEENAKYRKVIKDTLEFDPEILKRHVNFMNNPDEETAVAQFGKDDKYFGVCTMLVTMPGLPMFGHGQLEGFTEKYGMEYRRAMREEAVDEELFNRHLREIVPLIKKRYLFADAGQFLLYDFHTNGGVDENVIAYSNRFDDERALVIFNNAYGRTSGRVSRSVAFLDKQRSAEERTLTRRTLADGLSLSREEDVFCIYRDVISGQEYIHQSKSLAEQGLDIHLNGYGYHVFLDFRFQKDHADKRYGRLAYELGGRPVPNVAEAVADMLMRPVHEAFYPVVDPEVFHWLGRTALDATRNDFSDEDEVFATDLTERYARFLKKAAAETDLELAEIDADATVAGAAAAARHIYSILNEPAEQTSAKKGKTKKVDSKAVERLRDVPDLVQQPEVIIYLWKLLEPVEAALEAVESGNMTAIQHLRLEKMLRDVARGAGIDDGALSPSLSALNLLLHDFAWDEYEDERSALEALLLQPDAQALIGMNRYGDVWWFKREGLEALAWYLLAAERVRETAGEDAHTESVLKATAAWLADMEASEYRVDRLLGADPEPASARPPERDDEPESTR